MTVRILFFSLLRDITGAEEIERTFEGRGSMTVQELLDTLYGEWPGLKKWDGKILVAADLDYIGRDGVIKGGQEVAIMPPVQGG